MSNLYKYIQTFAISIAIVTLSSCDKNDDPKYTDVQPGFRFEISDTLVSAVSHVFDVKVTPIHSANTLKNWDFFSVSVWNDALASDNSDGWEIVSMGLSDKEIDLGWIKIGKKPTTGLPELNCEIKANTTGKKRKVRIIIGEPNGSIIQSGEIIVSQQAQSPEEESFEVKAEYKGKLYITIASLNEENQLVYENEEFAQLIQYLSEKSGVETVLIGDDIIRFYDDETPQLMTAVNKLMNPVPFNQNIGIRNDIVRSRAGDAFKYLTAGALGYCVLFDDTNFSDSYIYSNLTDLNSSYDVSNMKDHNLNNKISSVGVYYGGTDSSICSVLTVWQYANYNYGDDDRKKHRLSFVATSSNPRATWPNLKKIPCLNSSDSWNDMITSFSFHFGYIDSMLKNY